MPSTSPKQKRFMTIVAKNPDFAKSVGVPQAVGQEFHAADKHGMLRRKKQTGGNAANAGL